MSSLSLSCFCNPKSTTRTSHIFYTVRAKTSPEGTSLGRFGRKKYEEPKPLYQQQQRIRNNPTGIRRRQEVLGMCSAKDLDLNDVVVHAENTTKNSLLYGIYQFSRPFVIIGTLLSAASAATLALSSWNQLSPAVLWELLKALVPIIFMTIYISGINQLYDVEIDKVNKPYLPLASGVMSMKLGIGIVVTSLIASFGLGMKYGSPAVMVALLCLGLFGSLYSIELPFMRWKRNPFLTTVTIIALRALAVPFPYFIHMQKYVLGQPIVLSRAVIFTTWFMFLFSIVDALSKDIPDVEGDKMHGFKTLSVSIGKERVFWICVSILMAAYGGAIAIGVTSSSLLNKIVSVLGHFSLASILLYRSLQDDHLDTFYMLQWKLFCAEYFLIPFMR